MLDEFGILDDLSPLPCKSFNGYTSNPQLCKSCHRPVTEHVEYMTAHKEKKAKKEKEAKDKIVAEYEAKRKKLIELAEKEYEAKRKKLIKLAATEIDPEEELIDFHGVKITKSWEAWRKIGVGHG